MSLATEAESSEAGSTSNTELVRLGEPVPSSVLAPGVRFGVGARPRATANDEKSAPVCRRFNRCRLLGRKGLVVGWMEL